MEETGQPKAEGRRYQFAGISFATLISLSVIVAGGFISWGSASQKIEDAHKKNSEQDGRITQVEWKVDRRIDSVKQEIKLEIQESEQRTRQDIQELRRAVLTGWRQP